MYLKLEEALSNVIRSSLLRKRTTSLCSGNFSMPLQGFDQPFGAMRFLIHQVKSAAMVATYLLSVAVV